MLRFSSNLHIPHKNSSAHSPPSAIYYHQKKIICKESSCQNYIQVSYIRDLNNRVQSSRGDWWVSSGHLCDVSGSVPGVGWMANACFGSLFGSFLTVFPFRCLESCLFSLVLSISISSLMYLGSKSLLWFLRWMKFCLVLQSGVPSKIRNMICSFLSHKQQDTSQVSIPNWQLKEAARTLLFPR